MLVAAHLDGNEDRSMREKTVRTDGRPIAAGRIIPRAQWSFETAGDVSAPGGEGLLIIRKTGLGLHQKPCCHILLFWHNLTLIFNKLHYVRTHNTCYFFDDRHHYRVPELPVSLGV